MRLVVRLSTGFWLAWVRALSGCVSAGVRIWPFVGRAVMTGVRAWRVCLGVVIGFPVVTGWPLLFWLIQTRHGYRHWLQGIAIPWWIILGATTVMLLAAWASQTEPSAGECWCGTCLPSECTCPHPVSGRLSTFPQLRPSTAVQRLNSMFTEIIHRLMHKSLAWQPRGWRDRSKLSCWPWAWAWAWAVCLPHRLPDRQEQPRSAGRVVVSDLCIRPARAGG